MVTNRKWEFDIYISTKYPRFFRTDTEWFQQGDINAYATVIAMLLSHFFNTVCLLEICKTLLIGVLSSC